MPLTIIEQRFELVDSLDVLRVVWFRRSERSDGFILYVLRVMCKCIPAYRLNRSDDDASVDEPFDEETLVSLLTTNYKYNFLRVL